MHFLALFLLSMMMATSVQAYESPLNHGAVHGTAAPTGHGNRVVVQPCANRVRHVPRADVAYQPGVDAKGRAIVPPADLGMPPAAQSMLEQPVVVLRAPIAPYVPENSAAAGLTESFVHLGAVDTFTGDARLNGAPLTPPDACLDE